VSIQGAVFLSYAREDTAAAQRIAAALREAGIEVLFDEGELRGCEAWEAKITKQIGECALFVPIISAHTHLWLEGYYHLEWKLAEDRSHVMAGGRPFILPVTVDEACDHDAGVPHAFVAAQGVRLPDGEASPDFIQRVQHMLGLEAPPSSEAMARVLESALGAADPEKPGVRIGRYKLLEQIGEGGFGAVWLAEQHEPVRRRVALKIIKRGMDSREVIARFESERQALALMEHPNIAHFFDAAATDAGRPFFVMELVQGLPITRYCDENRVPVEARLRLFIAVCQAVQHAHHKGIIHRDIKPSNIIVVLKDGAPVPKVIDFGVAKATGPQLTEKTVFTQIIAFVGTPAYTSPEQLELSGTAVDRRSDIYSLGVLLYELLAGRPPFDSEALVKAGFEEMRRIIREVDPPRPSERLRALGDEDRNLVALQRGTDAANLTRLLRGGLDWVVMRCLEKDRARRYESVADLAADVERHLHDELVHARPPSPIYRARTFFRRHRVAVAAAAAGLVVLAAFFVRERAAQERVDVAENRVIVAEDRANAKSGAPPPSPAPVLTPTAAVSEARQLVRRADSIWDNGGPPSNDNLRAAEALCDRALALDPTDAEVWAEAARLDATFYSAGPDRSEARQRKAVNEAARAVALAPDLFSARFAQAAVLADAVRTPQALSQAEGMFEALLAETPANISLANYYGTVLRDEGRYDKAAAVFEKAGLLQDLAWSYVVEKKMDEANKAADRLLAQKRTSGALVVKAEIEFSGMEDLEAANAAVQQFTAVELQTEDPAIMALTVAYCLRDANRMIQLANSYPQDFLSGYSFFSPRRYWTGLAFEVAGRPEAARKEWQIALEQVRERLRPNPNDRKLLLGEAVLLAYLGQSEEARRTLHSCRILNLSPVDARNVDGCDWDSVEIMLRLGQREEVLAWMTSQLGSAGWAAVHAYARFSPSCDPLRGDPRLEKLLRDNMPKFAKPFDGPAVKTASAPVPMAVMGRD
jgi:serine/threonine protein kinase/tetratricopeptide (TPR) repeat protein